MRTFLYTTVMLSALCANGLFAQKVPGKPPEPGQLAQPDPAAKKGTQLPGTMTAAPFTIRDKFGYRVVQSLGLRGLGGSLVGAAIGQASDSPHEWGQGVEGFAKRYASGFAGNLSRQTFAFALESALHEDPRYFPSEGKGAKTRTWNALKQVFICKTDDGGTSFAYARLISNFGAGQFDNLWQPQSTGTVTRGLVRSFIGLGADAAYNLMQEFIPFTRPHYFRQGRLQKQP